jgi:hypothetical protein
MALKLLIGAAALLLAGIGAGPAHAQAGSRQAELQRQHVLCDQGYRPACIRFGIIIGQNRGRVAEWRREHPDWWWWQPWVSH